MVNKDILDKTESILIQHFSKKFIKERGREWFKGDLKEMMSEIEIILESNITEEKDEEIIDQNLEILLQQYLTAVKDRNDFLYKEVFDYFKKNNVSLNVQTDYS